jgi:hypothetical protein
MINFKYDPILGLVSWIMTTPFTRFKKRRNSIPPNYNKDKLVKR